MTPHNNKSNMTKPVILVTGSAKRIGAEIIRHAHASGYNCIIHYHRSSDSAKELANELNTIRDNSAETIQADLSLVNNEGLLAKFVANVMVCFGRLDALVNNASRFFQTPLHSPTSSPISSPISSPMYSTDFHKDRLADSDNTCLHNTCLHNTCLHNTLPHKNMLDSWDELFLTNAKAPLLLSHAFLPHLQQNQGNIINILDIHADNKPFISYSVYCMAKSAAHMMVQSLALELSPVIRVNGVSPGTNIFPEEDSDHAIDSDLQSQISHSIPLGRIGKPCDIANAVMYLLQAEYVTGQVIDVDGGRGLTIKGG